MKRCPKCRNELEMHKSNMADLRGLSLSKIKQLRGKEIVYYYCDSCVEYFLFLPSKVYKYNGLKWELFGIEPEKVIFT